MRDPSCIRCEGGLLTPPPGRAVALQFVRDGCARLVLSDLKEEELRETAALALAINPAASVQVYPGDASSEEFVSQLIAFVLQEFGRLDYAINGVGIPGRPGPTHETDPARFGFAFTNVVWSS